jgi:hypothetical protein
MTQNGGGSTMIRPPSGDPIPERCLACERGRCQKCWNSWSDYTTGNSWVCDCRHETTEEGEEVADRP